MTKCWTFPRILATLLTVGMLTPSAACAASPQQPEIPAIASTHKPPGAVGEKAFINVSVATLWSDPKYPRPLDQPSLTHPVALETWLAAMPDTESRRWLTGKTETQALLGTAVTVVELQGTWAKVVVENQRTPRDPRGYPGWVPLAQLSVNPSFDEWVRTREHAFVRATAQNMTVSGEPGTLRVSMNTDLPVLGSTPDTVQVALPAGGKGWLPRSSVSVLNPGQGLAPGTGRAVVANALAFKGLRYLWAGTSAYGFDCSGLTYSVFRQQGIDIPRDAGPQAASGTPVAADQLQPGDLLFFAKDRGKGKVHHVGLYLGSGQMVHSPNAAESISIVSWRSWDKGGEFWGARRYAVP